MYPHSIHLPVLPDRAFTLVASPSKKKSHGDPATTVLQDGSLHTHPAGHPSLLCLCGAGPALSSLIVAGGVWGSSPRAMEGWGKLVLAYAIGVNSHRGM